MKKRRTFRLITIDFDKEVPQQILDQLYELDINSVIVEGGTNTIEQFVKASLWDEARIIHGNNRLHDGIKAPLVFGKEKECFTLGDNTIKIIENED